MAGERRKHPTPSGLKALVSDEKARPIFIRYFLPVVVLLILVLLASLPMIAFRTGAGDSEAKSLFYWHTASFFGTDEANGAYDYLMSDTGVDNATTAWAKAVVVTVALSAFCAVIGALLTIVTSGTAIYLMLTEESTARARRVGRIFRVVVGNRVMLCVPYLFSLLPFVFPRLLAYYYTSLMFYDATASFALLDPLWIALVLVVVEFLYAAWTKDQEKRSKWDLFRPTERRVGMSERSLAEIDREWADAVRADAEGEGSVPVVHSVSERPAPQATEEEAAVPQTSGEPKKRIEDDSEEAQSMRESLQSLFSDVDEPKKHRDRHKKKGD